MQPPWPMHLGVLHPQQEDQYRQALLHTCKDEKNHILAKFQIQAVSHYQLLQMGRYGRSVPTVRSLDRGSGPTRTVGSTFPPSAISSSIDWLTTPFHCGTTYATTTPTSFPCKGPDPSPARSSRSFTARTPLQSRLPIAVH